MYPTAEVRWFYPGTVPPAVLAWFRGLEGTPEEESPRVDHYLRHAGGDSLGVKLREGRLEVKLRHAERGIIRFHRQVAGRVERWRKWSFGLVEAASPGPHPEVAAPHWLAVEKRRAQRRYGLDGERAVAVSPADLPDQGCDLELTRVRAGVVECWTLGLEAYGDKPALEKTPMLVARYLMTGAEPPSLGAGNSYGYPRWVLQIEQEPGDLPCGASGLVADRR